MATVAERVLDRLREVPEGLDDDELAAQLDTRRQAVNQVCRRLQAEGRIDRVAGPRGKIVNREVDGVAASPGRQTPGQAGADGGEAQVGEEGGGEPGTRSGPSAAPVAAAEEEPEVRSETEPEGRLAPEPRAAAEPGGRSEPVGPAAPVAAVTTAPGGDGADPAGAPTGSPSTAVPRRRWWHRLHTRQRT